MSDGGKGSAPRPFSVGQEEFGNKFEGIFGKKPPKQPYVYVPPENLSPEAKEFDEKVIMKPDFSE